MYSVTHRRVLLPIVMMIAASTAGCFQPLYGDKSSIGGANVRDNFRAVEVAPVTTTSAKDQLKRVGGVIRDELIFGLTGGSEANTSDYRLVVSIGASTLGIVVDPTTGRTDTQVYNIVASYYLIEIATGKTVIRTSTFASVTYDLPGQQQRFAGVRALRDAENRAAAVIAENIRSRLASYFTSGT